VTAVISCHAFSRLKMMHVHAVHRNAYPSAVSLVQVRDVPEATLRALKAQAAERGLTLSGYLRGELERLAKRPTNAEIAQRLARRNRRDGPTVADTVAEVRKTREAS
jgi:antitoxin FitA